MKDTLITGLPRSGTTLLTSLFAKTGQCTVFSEPDWLKEVRKHAHNASTFIDQFKAQTIELRNDIDSGRPLKLKIKNQDITNQPTNYYAKAEDGNILSDKREQDIILDSSFSNKPFVIKANAQFTATLSHLLDDGSFDVTAIVRNPVYTIMSWRSLNLPVSQGNLKIAEKYADDFEAYTGEAKDLLEKQVLIADWFFKTYHTHRQRMKLIQYEQLIKNPQETFERSYSLELPSGLVFNNQKNNPNYDHEEKQLIISKLKTLGQYWQYFYPDLMAC